MITPAIYALIIAAALALFGPTIVGASVLVRRQAAGLSAARGGAWGDINVCMKVIAWTALLAAPVMVTGIVMAIFA